MPLSDASRGTRESAVPAFGFESGITSSTSAENRPNAYLVLLDSAAINVRVELLQDESGGAVEDRVAEKAHAVDMVERQHELRVLFRPVESRVHFRKDHAAEVPKNEHVFVLTMAGNLLVHHVHHGSEVRVADHHSFRRSGGAAKSRTMLPSD